MNGTNEAKTPRKENLKKRRNWIRFAFLGVFASLVPFMNK
jgi:hypothetical protein